MEELQDFGWDTEEMGGLIDDGNDLERVKFMRKTSIVKIIKIADIMDFGPQFSEIVDKIRNMIKTEAVLIDEYNEIIDTWKSDI